MPKSVKNCRTEMPLKESDNAEAVTKNDSTKSERENMGINKSKVNHNINEEKIAENKTTKKRDKLSLSTYKCDDLLVEVETKRVTKTDLDTETNNYSAVENKVSELTIVEDNGGKELSELTVGINMWKENKEKEDICIEDKENIEEEIPVQGFVGKFAAEITEMIFMLLTPKDLASSSMVCRSWRDAINSDIIWRKHCKQRGWTTMLTDWSCFQNSSHLWSGVFFINDLDCHKLPPLCTQRLCFNKYAFLRKNWKARKFATFRLTKPSNSLLASSTALCFACDGKYIVMFENLTKLLMVWGLEGEPHKVDCDSCQQINVSNIIVGNDTFAMVQGPYISVYINKGLRFELAYIKSEFVELNNKQYQYNTTPEPVNIVLEINNDYLVGCAYCIEYLAYVWDRKSGDIIVTVTFDSQYLLPSIMKLYGTSIYFGLRNTETEHRVVEFDIKLNCWSNFSVDCLPHIKQLAVDNNYLCLVSSDSERRDYNNCVGIFNRATGMIIKSFKGCGKNYHFVNNYLVYHYNAKIVVRALEDDQPFREIYLNECIVNLKPVFDSLLVLTTAEKVEVWDWILEKKLYTASYTSNSSIEMWVDCEKIVLNKSKSNEVIVLRF